MKSMRLTLAALVLTTLAFALPARADLPTPDPTVAEFARGVKFTVAGYNGGAEVQTNFPVLVRLSTAITGFDYGDFYNDGSLDTDGDGQPNLELIDIGFVDAEGNGLAYDIDTWNTSGESLVWVNLPRMTNGTEFAMWYRSSKTGKALNPDNVWTNYAGVWHFSEDYGTESGSVKVYDSTTNSLTGDTYWTSSSKSSSYASGKPGRSRKIATANNPKGIGAITVPLGTTGSAKRDAVDKLGQAFSASFWARPEADARYNYFIGRKNADIYESWALQQHDKITAWRIYSNGTDGKENTGYAIKKDVSGFSINNWTKIDIVYTTEGEKGKYYLYYDGVAKGNGALSPGNVVQGGLDFYIGGGADGGDCRPFIGEMDEVRLCYNVPTEKRIKADFDTVNTAAFLTADMVVTNAIIERPVVSFTIADVGASHIQFAGTLSSLGSDQATKCIFYAKVWPSSGSEPTWTVLGTDLGVGAFSGLSKGLMPATAYSYKLKVANDEDVDSYETADDFTTSGVGVSGTGGDITRVGDDWIHYFRVAIDENDATTNRYVFTPPSYASTVRALVVAGGGPGGYKAGGGGGAGGYVYNAALDITSGNAYTITVGEGGAASDSADNFGTNGGNSSITNRTTSEGVLTSIGGGAGGNYSNNANKRVGQTGGSGGGSPHSNSNAGSGTEGQGNAGGKGNSKVLAGGGGGASGTGVSAPANGLNQNAGAGGAGLECDITGTGVYYAGGGGGGGMQVADASGSPGAGGNGGGGTGSRKDASGVAAAATQGVDGLGGGGGGGCGDDANLYKGGDGGDGIVIIRYASQGDYTAIPEPIISLESAVCNDATFQGDVTFRVAWAGYGCETANVKIAWGYSKNHLIHETDLIATGVVGRASGSFDLISDECTVYCRAIAINGNNISSESTETLAFYVNDNPNARIDDATPILANVGLSCVDVHYAVVTGIVVSTGVSSADPKTCTVRVNLGSNEHNLAPAAGVSGTFPLGAFSLNIGNLDHNTTYYYNVEAEDDNGMAVETDPESFTTLLAGNPSGYFLPDENNPAVARTANSLAASIHVTTRGEEATSARVYLDVSATSSFEELVASANKNVTADNTDYSFTISGLEPETAYYLRRRIVNNANLADTYIIGPFTTLKPPRGVMFLVY